MSSETGRALPCCNDLELADLTVRRCGGTMTRVWPIYRCDQCRAHCGALVHPQHATPATESSDESEEQEASDE